MWLGQGKNNQATPFGFKWPIEPIFFPAHKGLKQQSRPKSHMIHQVIKGARNLHRESYALLKLTK